MCAVLGRHAAPSVCSNASANHAAQAMKLLYVMKRALFRASPRLAERLNLNFALQAPSREFLEKQIFGLLNTQLYGRRPRRCLFIGLDKHNWHYCRLLDCEFHSIDINPANAVYGQHERHVVGSALHLSDYYEGGAFAAVIANGLVGFGVNDEDNFNHMMAQIHHVVEPGGLLVLGYNNRPDRASFSVEQSAGCRLFEPFVPAIAGVESPAYEVSDGFRHRYVFLRKGISPLTPDTTPPAPAARARP